MALLLRIHSQVRILQRSAEKFKGMTKSWKDYERIRKHLTDKHFLDSESDIERLRNAIEDISGHYPILAVKLRVCPETSIWIAELS
jgi:hypothetical protein